VIAVGDVVRCQYRARWVGVVLDLDPTIGEGCALVLPRLTADGRPQPSAVKARWLAVSWLTPVTA